MKKPFLALALIVLCAPSVKLHAAAITVGATAWYAWWDRVESKVALDPALLAGPALSVSLADDLRLNTVFYYGKFNAHPDAEIPGSSGVSCKRYDSDTSLSCRINGYLTALAGFKYMYYRIRGDEYTETITFPVYLVITVPAWHQDHETYGPAAGVIFTLPLTGGLSASAGITGIYLWGHSSGTEQPAERNNDYGYNSSISLTYFSDAASVALSIGGRYQYYRSYHYSGSSADSDYSFYGITAGAAYTFSL